jgi:hypothetical protein
MSERGFVWLLGVSTSLAVWALVIWAGVRIFT